MRTANLVYGIVLSALCAAGCSDTHVNQPNTRDKNTNWLKPCPDDGDCGGDLRCHAGVCTVACASDAICEGRPIAAYCPPASEGERYCAALPRPANPSDASVGGAGASGGAGSGPRAGAGAAGTSPSVADAGLPDANSGPIQPAECDLNERGREPGPAHTDSRKPGTGPCSDTPLADVLAAIAAAHPEIGPIGYVFDPQSPPPPSEPPNIVFAFDTANDSGFAIAIAQACEGECTTGKHYYFRTDDSCAPVAAGEFGPLTVDLECEDVEGLPLWDKPPPSSLSLVCDELRRPARLPTRVSLTGCGTDRKCSRDDTTAAAALDLELELEQTADDPGRVRVRIRGTGHPILEDLWIPADNVRGHAVAVAYDGRLPTACAQPYHVSAVFDLSGNQRSYLSYEESLVPDCNEQLACKGALNLDFGRLPKGGACYPMEDINRSVALAQAPLLACETDDDCTHVSLATPCMSSCSTAVRVDQAAVLEAAIERAGEAYCPDATCGAIADCAQVQAVCRQGKCAIERL